MASWRTSWLRRACDSMAKWYNNVSMGMANKCNIGVEMAKSLSEHECLALQLQSRDIRIENMKKELVRMQQEHTKLQRHNARERVQMQRHKASQLFVSMNDSAPSPSQIEQWKNEIEKAIQVHRHLHRHPNSHRHLHPQHDPSSPFPSLLLVPRRPRLPPSDVCVSVRVL